MTEFTPTYVDNARWTITTNCENPEIIIQVADYLYTEDGITLANWGVEGVSYETVDNSPEFTDLIMDNPDGYAYRDALALHTMDGVGTVYDPLRGASGYTALQLSSWDDWTDANLDYSRALPSKEMLNADEKSEYATIYSDIETVLDEAITKLIIGDMSIDSYDTEVVGKLESMNIQRCIDLYQQAYDRYTSR
jgi:putative aldouronate transport system substrate-binding protein